MIRSINIVNNNTYIYLINIINRPVVDIIELIIKGQWVFVAVKVAIRIKFLIIVGFFIFVSTCILERVISHLEGMCSDHK